MLAFHKAKCILIKAFFSSGAAFKFSDIDHETKCINFFFFLGGHFVKMPVRTQRNGTRAAAAAKNVVAAAAAVAVSQPDNDQLRVSHTWKG